MLYKEFQQLRIYQGWEVTWNRFTTNVDKLTNDDVELQYSSSYHILGLYSQSRNLSISVDWKYEDSKGYYELEMYNVLEIFNLKTNSQDLEFQEEPHTIFKTDKTQELIDKLEHLMWFSKEYIDPRILKNRGEIDEPSESYRITLERSGFTKELINNILTDGNKQVQHIALECKGVNREIIVRFQEESKFTKMKKKATQMLKNKKFR